MFDTPGNKSNYTEEDSGNCGLKFGTMNGPLKQPELSMQTYDIVS